MVFHALFVVLSLAIAILTATVHFTVWLAWVRQLIQPITGRQKASDSISFRLRLALTLITTQLIDLLTESPSRVISFHHLGCYADASISPPRYFCKSVSVAKVHPDLSLCPFWARRNIHFRRSVITRVQDDDLLLLDLSIWQWSVTTGIGLPW